MIIIPTLEILKAVTDINITSPASKPRRDAFDAAINLFRILGLLNLRLNFFLLKPLNPLALLRAAIQQLNAHARRAKLAQL